MKTIEVTREGGFAFAERGVEVHEYAEGQVVEVSDECAEVALTEKWAKETKAKPNAPENK